MEELTEADKEYKVGENIMNSNYFFKKLFGMNQYEDAAEHFDKAAKLYKRDKKYLKAAKAYYRYAECKNKISDNMEECQAYVNAYSCLKFVNSKDTMACIEKIIDLSYKHGNCEYLIKWYRILGDIYANDGRYEDAVLNYEKSFEYDDNSISNEYQTKMAYYLILLEKYFQAIDVYKKIYDIYNSKKALQYALSPICLTLLLLYLVLDDTTSAQRYYNEIKSIPHINERQLTFMSNLISVYQENNIDQFVDLIREYDNIAKLDTLHLNLLLKIKHNFETIDSYL